jgi:hypothetical protein
MDKPAITLDLNEYIEDFLIHDFGRDQEGRITVTHYSPVGLLIDSLWESSDYPVKSPERKNPVTLVLPVRPDDWYQKTGKFIYVPEKKEIILRQNLEYEFQRRIRDFFSIGYEKKFKQKDIIDSFLSAYNIKHNALNFDQMKKWDYRTRKRFKESVGKEIKSLTVNK